MPEMDSRNCNGSEDSDEVVQTALASAANGFCLKEVKSDRLCSAIRSVHLGELVDLDKPD